MEKTGTLATVGKWYRRHSRPRPWVGWVAAVLFLTVATASIWKLPPVELNWAWLVVAVLMVLPTRLLIAMEYRLSALLVGRDVGWISSLRVTIISTAANLLPIPGGVMVRTEGLRREGSALKHALASNAVIGLGWVGVALVLAGIFMIGDASSVVVASSLGAGFAVITGMWVATWSLVRSRRSLHLGLVVLLLESVYVAMSAARLFAILAAFSLSVSYSQAVTLTLASALAAGIGFFPGGLGIREVIAAALAPIVGVAPVVGAFAGVADRVVGLAVNGGLAVFLWRPLGGRGAEK